MRVRQNSSLVDEKLARRLRLRLYHSFLILISDVRGVVIFSVNFPPFSTREIYYGIVWQVFAAKYFNLVVLEGKAGGRKTTEENEKACMISVVRRLTSGD